MLPDAARSSVWQAQLARVSAKCGGSDFPHATVMMFWRFGGGDYYAATIGGQAR
jgi:hypothetical protein